MATSLLTKIAISIATLAIALGMVGRVAPDLFFRIPNVGFILWTITTGKALPPYIVHGPFDDHDWLRDDDVVVSVDAKSGTTWMLFCSHQIRVKGNDELHPYEDTMLSTPWVEMLQEPGLSWETQKDLWNTTVLENGKALKDYWNHESYPFRIFKSHNLPTDYGELMDPTESKTVPKIKFLAMARNGLDQVASMTPFFNGHTDGFRNKWGGFPPASKGTLREDSEQRLKDMSPGGIFDGLHFKYVNSWWKYKERDNVLLLHYSDAKKDLDGTVSKMADFYGVKLTKKEKNTVVKKCSFDYMKTHEHMFGYKLPFSTDPDLTIMKPSDMIRKGKNGDGQIFFTEEEKESWAKLEEEHFADDAAKLEWARNGGGF